MGRAHARGLAAGGLAVATLALLTRCVLSPAPPPHVPRVGVLASPGSSGAAFLEPLRGVLREQDFVDGHNVLTAPAPRLTIRSQNQTRRRGGPWGARWTADTTAAGCGGSTVE